MNNYSEFQVNICSNNRDIRLHLENSKSKKGHNFVKTNWSRAREIVGFAGSGPIFETENRFISRQEA